jgi:hypothetical protein
VGASNDEGTKFLVGMVTDCNTKVARMTTRHVIHPIAKNTEKSEMPEMPVMTIRHVMHSLGSPAV